VGFGFASFATRGFWRRMGVVPGVGSLMNVNLLRQRRVCMEAASLFGWHVPAA